MHDSGIDAVRKKKDSSISKAVDLVKDGAAEAVVSAGNTGAPVTASTIKLRMLPGIERPAIAALMPTESGGYSCSATPARIPTRRPSRSRTTPSWRSPTASTCSERRIRARALMSNGTEEFKGNELALASYALLKASGLNFHGNVEGHDLFEGTVDVVVTDGFTGNVILKTSEALAKSIFRLLKRELMATPLRKSARCFASRPFAPFTISPMPTNTGACRCSVSTASPSSRTAAPPRWPSKTPSATPAPPSAIN
jgi:glycerol-3-phosphate acyltransferase PlsX